MPPKGKYTKTGILNAAFELVKEEGLEVLSARNIAKRIGCSTQPIYSSFRSIEELENEVVELIKARTRAAILEVEDDESNFLAIGLGYFKFAQEQPRLFTSMFVNGGWKWNFSRDDPFFRPILEKMKRDSFLKDLDDDKLTDLFRDMFIYTHGLATQSHLSNEPITPERARELLKKMGGILIVSAKITGSFNIEKFMKRFHGWTE